MSRILCVMGESGSGKTTAMRTLDPKTTYYIDCDKKGLSWKGWREQYSAENKNYFATRDIPKITTAMHKVSENRSDIKTIVVDTLNTCMVDKEVKSMNENGFGKWIELTTFVWNACEEATLLRDDITVVIVMHSETIRDDLGYNFTRIKTNGRKLEKVILESLFTVVLLAKRNDEGNFVFETQSKQSTCKTPLDAFTSLEIPNDMQAVLTALKDY